VTQRNLLDTPAPRARKLILVVDDEPMVRNLARTVLEQAGFQVLTACDGDDGLRMYHELGSTIDLILLDYTMPGRSGLQVLQELRRLQADVRVILSSGTAQDDEVQQFLDAGAVGFIAKPYRPQDLVDHVRRALGEPS
jgi:CheY-like chemotaxis protein